MSEEGQEKIESNEGSEHVDFGLDKHRHENGLILGKFKGEDDLIKSYTELERKQSSTPKVEIPDAYDVSLGEDIKDKFILDNNILEAATPIFKECNLSNDAVNKMINFYADMEIKKQEAVVKDIEASLGNNKKDILSDINLFANAKLNEEEREVLLNMPSSGKEALLIHKLINLTRSGNIPMEASKAPSRSAQSYLDEAFAYEKEHKATIGSNPSQQEHYNKLMEAYANARR